VLQTPLFFIIVTKNGFLRFLFWSFFSLFWDVQCISFVLCYVIIGLQLKGWNSFFFFFFYPRHHNLDIPTDLIEVQYSVFYYFGLAILKKWYSVWTCTSLSHLPLFFSLTKIILSGTYQFGGILMEQLGHDCRLFETDYNSYCLLPSPICGRYVAFLTHCA